MTAGRLDPAACDITTESYGFDIRHRPSGSYVRVFTGTFHHKVEIKVGDSRRQSWTLPPFLRSSQIIKSIQDWAKRVKEYEEMPDFWDLRRDEDLLTSSQYDAADNTPFTLDEQAAISVQIAQIKEYVKKTYSLTEEQMSRVEARLDEAEEASSRISRKDWILLFSGSIFTLIIAGTVTPDIAQHVMMMAFHGLGHLFYVSNRGTRGRSCCRVGLGMAELLSAGRRRTGMGWLCRAADCRGYGPGPGSLAGRRRARPWGVQGRKGSRPAPAGAVPPLRAHSCR